MRKTGVEEPAAWPDAVAVDVEIAADQVDHEQALPSCGRRKGFDPPIEEALGKHCTRDIAV